VDKLASLLLHGGDHMGMAVTGGDDGDAGGEVIKVVAINVSDDDAASTLGHQWIGASVGGRNIFFIAGQHALGVGAGQSGLDLGSVSSRRDGSGHSFCGHGILRKAVASGYWPVVSKDNLESSGLVQTYQGRGESGGG